MTNTKNKKKRIVMLNIFKIADQTKKKKMIVDLRIKYSVLYCIKQYWVEKSNKNLNIQLFLWLMQNFILWVTNIQIYNFWHASNSVILQFEIENAELLIYLQ